MLKPQSAFFEAYGSAGVAVLERLIAAARQAGALVLLDVKRGDIGSTMAAYAAAYLAEGAPLAADAVTLSPYLGFGSLDPALDLAEQTGRGVFVLALTSNKEGAPVQRATGAGRATRWPRRSSTRPPPATPARARSGPVGLVIGATVGRTELDLSTLNGTILAPGFGAQGGTLADLRTVFGDEPAPRAAVLVARDPAARPGRRRHCAPPPCGCATRSLSPTRCRRPRGRSADRILHSRPAVVHKSRPPLLTWPFVDRLAARGAPGEGGGGSPYGRENGQKRA